MKKIAILIFVLLFFGSFDAFAAGTQRHVVSPDEYIWKISKELRLEAEMDASNKSVAETAEKIIVYSGLDMAMNDGNLTNDPNDPDFLYIGQALIIPVLGSKEEIKSTSEPTPPTQAARVSTPVVDIVDDEPENSVNVTNEDHSSPSLGLTGSTESINTTMDSLNLVSSSISGITEEIDSIDSHGNDQAQKIEDLRIMVENLKVMVEDLTTRVEVLKSIKTRHSRTSSSLLENN